MSGTVSEICYVYLALCSDGSYYTGITNNPARRMMLHNTGKGSKYVRARRPAKIVGMWSCFDGRREAAHIEAKIKKMSHVEKARLANHERDLPCSKEMEKP
jgi:putative endonuclease